MGKKVVLTGNDAVAEALRQINPDVAAVFPITPQTELMHKFSEFVADGKVKTNLVCVESEHSAMSACVGSQAAGARTVTATSANGLALMWEIVYIAASLRLPIFMPVINRALSGPINIHCDHSDTMGCRDSGWIQLFSENAQEAYDNAIMALRIAEHKDVLLPAMITLDGFIISHTMETLEILNDKTVTNFVGEYKPQNTLLDTDNPVTYGPLDLQDYFFEHKRQQIEAMKNVPSVILDVAKEYEKISGRKYDLFEKYKTEDADIILIALGSTAGTAKVAVDNIRKEGIKAGLIKIRTFRPFPSKELSKALEKAKAVLVLDRSASYGTESGPVYIETKSALYGKNIPIINYLYGLGGRDISNQQIEKVIKETDKNKDNLSLTSELKYIGLRE
jgi:pyruvate ferredoxin oxidoreductase alpha subunit